MPFTLVLEGVSCIYKSKTHEVRAVDGVDLTVAPGEFFTLLGPSGSGKTTCLRLIGGFADAHSGKILIDGVDYTTVAANVRPVNTVFQDYALFPHFNVLDNVAYGLMVRKMPKAERHAKALAMLERVQLAAFASRQPSELSGGQRQRVALARALVLEPKLLLLDEPLGALDLKLREHMQVELKALQRQLGISFVLVTHDQHEALLMSDRIGVFHQGRIEQIGTPEQIYQTPTTRFVAEFIGAVNFFDGVEREKLGMSSDGHNPQYPFLLRPERIAIVAKQNSYPAKVQGVVTQLQYFGAFSRIFVTLTSGITLQVDHANHTQSVEIGETVGLHWHDTAVHTLVSSV